MYSQFEDLLKGTVTSFKSGDEVRGTVVDVSRKGAYVDIGGKGAAFAGTENLCCAPVADVRYLWLWLTSVSYGHMLLFIALGISMNVLSCACCALGRRTPNPGHSSACSCGS